MSVLKVVLGFVLCATTIGCGDSDPAASDWEAGLALGVRDDGKTKILSSPELFLQEVSATGYDGEGIVEVRSEQDVTQVDDTDPEQVLRITTADDSEVLSTWDGLRASGSSTSKSPDGKTHYSVWLLFDAVVSDEPTRDNGIVELKADQDSIDIVWECSLLDQEFDLSVELAKPAK